MNFGKIGFWLHIWEFYVVTNFRKKIRTITGGPWWTQIKVILIQKGLLDNRNPGFCMGWPGLYLLLDNIDQLGTLCLTQNSQSECLKARKKHKFFYHSLHLDRGTFQQLKNVMHSILTEVDSDLFRPFEGKCFNLSNCHSIVLFEGFFLNSEKSCTAQIVGFTYLPFENSNF